MLHPVVFIFGETGLFFGHLAVEGEIARLDLLHPFFNLFEIVGRKFRRAVEVVVEAVFSGRTDAELGLGKQFEDGSGEQVRSGVAVDLQSLWILVGEDFELGVTFERASEVIELAVDAGDDRGISQARADGFGDIKGLGSTGNRLLAAVGQRNGETAAHVQG